MLASTRVTLIGPGLRGLGSLDPDALVPAHGGDAAVKLQASLISIGKKYPDYPKDRAGAGDLTMQPIGASGWEVDGTVSLVTVMAVVNTILQFGDTLSSAIPGGVGDKVQWFLDQIESAKRSGGIAASVLNDFLQPWAAVSTFTLLDDFLGLIGIGADEFTAAMNDICAWVASNAGAINTGLEAAGLIASSMLPPTTPAPTSGAYPAGSVARFNTSRNVWSIYPPSTGATVKGLGMYSDGRCIYGDCGGLGTTAPVPFPEPSPASPTGQDKVAEVPGSPATPPTDAKTGAPLPNVGTEKDKPFYMKWWFLTSLGGAAALGVGAYFLLRDTPSKPVGGARPVVPKTVTIRTGIWREEEGERGQRYYEVSAAPPWSLLYEGKSKREAEKVVGHARLSIAAGIWPPKTLPSFATTWLDPKDRRPPALPPPGLSRAGTHPLGGKKRQPKTGAPVSEKKLEWVVYLTSKKDPERWNSHGVMALSADKRLLVFPASQGIPEGGEYDRKLVWRGSAETSTDGIIQADRAVRHSGVQVSGARRP
jgi:hypothetical protein